ncbi:MAG: VWA domain-containing protein, partial [Chloroflexota bacterium]|nr:VWA domain-containing protein [Chloroflexota bacterium]
MIFRSPHVLWLLPLLLIVGGLVARRSAVTRPVLLLRALLLVLLVAALADPVRPGTAAASALLVLVDGSASVAPERREAAWQTALDVAARHGSERTTLAIFGRNVAVATGRSLPAIDNTASDLPGALRVARGLLGGAPGRVLLISDGASTSPGAEAAAAELQAAGIAVDVLPLPPDDRLDARVVAVDVPAGLREGQSYRGEVTLATTGATTAILRLKEEDEPATEQTVTLQPGRNSITFAGTAGRSGVHRFSAELQLADAHVENNRLERAVIVGPSPRVLVIEREPDSAAALRDLLEQGGVQSEARRPADLPHRLSDLERFDAVVLQDVPATALSLDQQSTLREYVRALGHGLLAIGGVNSFGLGNYRNTPLEDVLPVDMRPPPRRERQAVALLLIIDRSSSMYGRDPQTSKMEMAKSAAIASTQALVPNDRLGVVIFDTEPEWSIEFTTIGEGAMLSQIQDELARIQIRGGTDIYKALALGLPALAAEGTATGVGAKHAVLLTDGKSYGEDIDYDQLIADARRNGITLSTIAIGDDADTVLLKRLADQGSGRYYFAADPQQLPRLTLQETEIAREDPRVEGELQPQPNPQAGTQAHPT